MSNSNHIIAMFKSEHERVMHDLGIQGQCMPQFSEMDFYKNLFLFSSEINYRVVINNKSRRGVSIYEDYWHAACALLPEGVAKTDLIHALLMIFIISRDYDVEIPKKWASARSSIFNRIEDEYTLASVLVHRLKGSEWINPDEIISLLRRGDLFHS